MWDGHAHRASAQETKPPQTDDRLLEELQTEIARLTKDVAVLRGKIPDQAHSMLDVDYHFSNLWFAGQAENWSLAKFYWGEAVSHMKRAVRIIPVRKDNAGNEIKLEATLKSILQSPRMQVGQTIEQKDVRVIEQCNGQQVNFGDLPVQLVHCGNHELQVTGNEKGSCGSPKRFWICVKKPSCRCI